LFTHYCIPPQYTANISMYVYNNENRSETTINDLNMSVKLVNTYIVILKSNTVLEEVAVKSGIGYSAEQIAGMISATSVNDTEVFEIKVTSKSAEHARIIAQTITEVAPVEIMRVVKAGSVEIIDTVQQNPPQTSPNIIQNITIGVLLGFILAAAMVMISWMLDKTIRSEKEVTDAFGYPVLGSIPVFEKLKSRGEKYAKEKPPEN